MFALSFECGSLTSSWYAEFALRRRVKKSAMGSVIVMVTCQPFSPGSPLPGTRTAGPVAKWELMLLPAGLADAGQLARVCHLAKADPAEPELAEHGVRAAAPLAAGVGAHGELRLLRGLVDQCFLGHRLSSP